MADSWDVPTFLFDYMMVGIFPVLFFGWKFVKKTKWLKPYEVDLHSGVEEIEEYTRNYVPSVSRFVTSALLFLPTKANLYQF